MSRQNTISRKFQTLKLHMDKIWQDKTPLTQSVTIPIIVFTKCHRAKRHSDRTPSTENVTLIKYHRASRKINKMSQEKTLLRQKYQYGNIMTNIALWWPTLQFDDQLWVCQKYQYYDLLTNIVTYLSVPNKRLPRFLFFEIFFHPPPRTFLGPQNVNFRSCKIIFYFLKVFILILCDRGIFS